MLLENKVVVITGGASGLGRVLVEEFYKEGAKICFTYRNSKEKAEDICKRLGDNVLAVSTDVSNFDEVDLLIKKAVEKFGKIDVLVNNAASAKDGSVEKIAIDDFDFTVKNVLYPVFYTTKCAIPELIKTKGIIVNISSINGLRGREGSLAYSSAKGAVIAFTKTVAKELGKYEVNCNVIAPGYIDTDGQKNTSELIKKMVLDECAIRHLTTPEEVADLVLFLSSDKAKCITGQTYQIDCGQYI